MKKLMAANWKMYKTVAEGVSTAEELVRLVADALPGDREVLLCPPCTMLEQVGRALEGRRGFFLGAQNFYPASQGAFTGELAPEQLRDAGCAYALVGHSERRQLLGEDDVFIGRKLTFGLQAGVNVILCVGETMEERRAGRVEEVLGRQLRTAFVAAREVVCAEKVAVAYEPVWAIGSGEVAGPRDILAAHAYVRGLLEELLPGQGQGLRILYGGSVKPDNAAEIIHLDNVDGVLVGGASLRADSFSRIVLA